MNAQNEVKIICKPSTREIQLLRKDYCPSRLASAELTHNHTCSSSRAFSACALVLKLTNAIGCKEEDQHAVGKILLQCTRQSYMHVGVLEQAYNAQHLHSNAGKGVVFMQLIIEHFTLRALFQEHTVLWALAQE